MDLVEETAVHRLEGTVEGSRRTAGIGGGTEGFTPIALIVVAYDQFSGEEIDFLPVLVNEGRRCVDTGKEAQQPGTATPFILFIKTTRQNLLLDTTGLALGAFPSFVHVQSVKFLMLFPDRHI